MPNKAQGTIEYLVILAVVVIVALIVVSLMINSTAPAAGISSTTTQIASASNPLAITETIVDTDGNYFLKIQNNTGENVTVTEIQIGDNNSATPDKTIPISGEEAFILNTEDVCIGGQLVVEEIIIAYTDNYGLNKKQVYPVQINFNCETYTATVTYTDETGTTYDEDGNPVGGPQDTTPPVIYLSSPADGVPVGNIVDFVFSVSDDSAIDLCNLIFDDSVVDTINNPSAGTNTFQDINIWAEGASAGSNYGWDVNCIDVQGYNDTNSAGWVLNYPFIYLSSTGAGTFSEDENLVVNFNPYQDSSKTYVLNWYQDDNLAAASLIEDNLLGYWPLDNGGDDFGTAFSGYDTDLEPQNSPVASEGKKDGGYDFDTDKFFKDEQYGTNPLRNKLGGCSWIQGVSQSHSIWVKPHNTIDSSATERYYFHRVHGGYYFSFSSDRSGVANQGHLVYMQHYYSPHYYSCYPATPDQGLPSTNDYWPANKWIHVVGTWDGTTQKLYINGQLDVSCSFAWGPKDWGTCGANSFNIGYANATYNLDSTLDELIIWEGELSADDVSRIYEGTRYGGHMIDSSLLSAGEQWKVGYKTSSDGINWSSDVNSALVVIS